MGTIKNKIIKNPLNYVGSKDRLIAEIVNNLPEKENLPICSVDLFAGSGVVTANIGQLFKKCLVNDKCWRVSKILHCFYKKDTNELLKEIDNIIKAHNLSKQNKEEYSKAREYFNENYSNKDDFNPIFLYALITHAFNYQLGFNSKGYYNVPSGFNRSSFNSSIRSKLIEYCKAIKDLDLIHYSADFNKVIDNLMKIKQHNTFYFVDPPYFNSDNSYSRTKELTWTEEHERLLYTKLDIVHRTGGKFMVTNTIENNGKVNNILKEWCKNYNVVELNNCYSNCNYQRKNSGKTIEVIIKNY